jgi:hypothetical protein
MSPVTLGMGGRGEIIRPNPRIPSLSLNKGICCLQMQWEKETSPLRIRNWLQSPRSAKMDRIYMERQELGREKAEGAANVFKNSPRPSFLTIFKHDGFRNMSLIFLQLLGQPWGNNTLIFLEDLQLYPSYLFCLCNSYSTQ